uniref:PBPe domain-containing protein n=1 Tax=Macrostomum lignano TaxID=282301 RepID=A0A1I8J506_9PLAT
MVGAVWWFFTLILISSYTANLAAFLTVTRLNDISSIGDLASQTSIKYGTLMGGSTYNFFKNSEISVYKTMWESMSGWAKTNESFMSKTSEGIEKVRRGGYAYILESTFNTYYRERDCSLMQVGTIFNPMSYAFGVNHGNVGLRDRLTEEILKLQKEQFIEGLTEKWLKRYNVSQPCSDQARNAQETGTLDVDAVGGVFVSLLIGLAIAAGICFIELIVRAAMSFQEIALKQVKLAVSCSNTNSPADVNDSRLPPSSVIAAREIATAQLNETSSCLLPPEQMSHSPTGAANATAITLSSKEKL